MVKVLFVCLGNICRSPMAEAVFMHKVRQAGLESSIEADSAGTGPWMLGEPPHEGTRAILAEKHIDYAHTARTITARDITNFDLILTMDDDNYNTVRTIARGKGSVRRLLDFAPGSGLNQVPDPWYDGNFERTYQLVDEAADGVLAFLREKYGL